MKGLGLDDLMPEEVEALDKIARQKGSISQADIDAVRKRSRRPKERGIAPNHPGSSYHPFASARRGKAPDLDHGTKSLLETNTARLLKFYVKVGEILKYEYEPMKLWFPIKGGTNFYIPDYWIIDKELRIRFIECKGFLSPEGKTKLRRWMREYPEKARETIYIVKAAGTKEHKQIRMEIDGDPEFWFMDELWEQVGKVAGFQTAAEWDAEQAVMKAEQNEPIPF